MGVTRRHEGIANRAAEVPDVSDRAILLRTVQDQGEMIREQRSGDDQKRSAEEKQQEQGESQMAIRNLIPVLTDFLIDKDFMWHVTANFNRSTNYAAGRDKIKTWAAFIDRKLHGRLYYRKPIEQRLFFIALPELGACGDNLHYHLLVRVPSASKEKFQRVAEPTWQSLVKCGSLFVQDIADSDLDRQRVVSYDLKDIRHKDNYANMIISSEFSPLDAVIQGNLSFGVQP